MENRKAWTLAIIFGFIGVIISGAIFFAMMYYTDRIFGLVAIACGFISGGAAGLGYRIGKGSIHGGNVKKFLTVSALFGLLGVAAGYMAPYVYLASQLGRLFTLSGYFALMEYGFMDLLFIAIGAWGGRWAGQKVGLSIVYKNELERHPIQLKIKD